MARSIEEVRQMLKEEAEEMKQEAEQPTTLLGKWFQEADYDGEGGESLEDIEKDLDSVDSDDNDDGDNDEKKDDDELGKDDSDVQNEYDENELNTLNDLIADEQHAMQQYFKAGKETKSVVLSRLYNDIGAEEAFHSEQLLYAKAELTGEKYEPSDPEVKKEYEELLENGMDEETAMYTIADRHKLEGNYDEEDMEGLEDIEKDLDTLNEAFVQTIANCEMLIAIQETAAYKNHAELRQAYCEFAENVMIMEAVDNISIKNNGGLLGSNNPLVIIGKAIKAIYSFIISIIRKVKNWVAKRQQKMLHARAWLKRNGIKGLFQDGISLYFYNPKTGDIEVSDAAQYLNLLISAIDFVQMSLKIPVACKPKQKTYVIPMPSKPAIIFSNIADAKDKISGVVFTKLKVIVTDQNATKLEDMFFGYTDSKFATSSFDDSTGRIVNKGKSMNIYNALNMILEKTADYSKALDEWLTEVQKLSMKSNSIFYNNPDKFRECVGLLKVVSKGFTKLTKCLNSDIATCIKLDHGLLAAINESDEYHSAYRTAETNGEPYTGPNPTNVSTEGRDSAGNVRRVPEAIK